MYVASGVMLADDVVTRSGYGIGGAILVLLAIPFLASAANKKAPRSVKKKASGTIGVVLAFVALALVGKSTGNSGSSTPPAHTSPPAVTSHQPATHKPATHKVTPPSHSRNSCKPGALICFHN